MPDHRGYANYGHVIVTLYVNLTSLRHQYFSCLHVISAGIYSGILADKCCCMLKSGFTAARLVSTTKQPAQGTLELYYKQQWGRVCNSGFNVKEATVVCRMLGYLT